MDTQRRRCNADDHHHIIIIIVVFVVAIAIASRCAATKDVNVITNACK